MASCESGFMIYILLGGVTLKRVLFRFWLEDFDIQVEFRNILRSLSLFTIRLADEFEISFILFISFWSG